MKILCVSIYMVLALAGCGGGGDVGTIPATGVPITRFLGLWYNTNPDPKCALDVTSNFFYSEGPMLLKTASNTEETSSYTESYDYFEDAKCTIHRASSFARYDLEWSVPSSERTKIGAIRARISNPKYSVSGDLLPPPITSDPSITYKVLFDVVNGSVSSYFDVVTPELDRDAEGFPLGTTPPLFTYTRQTAL
jgi:hypothetical protein